MTPGTRVRPRPPAPDIGGLPRQIPKHFTGEIEDIRLGDWDDVLCLCFSLPPNKDNPFLPSEPVSGANGSQNELSRKVGGWNPFGDTQSFGAVTEDALFGKSNSFILSQCDMNQQFQERSLINCGHVPL